jgi:hypothetical protein
MKRIQREGRLPLPIKRLLGLSDEKTQNAIWEVYGYPEVWECISVEEFGTATQKEECEVQPLIDRETGRYFLTSMTIDAERLRTKMDEVVVYDQRQGKDVGVPVAAPDDSPKPTTVVHYIEISESQYKKWASEDYKKRAEIKKTNTNRRGGGILL